MKRNWTVITTLVADALTLVAILFLVVGVPLFLLDTIN